MYECPRCGRENVRSELAFAVECEGCGQMASVAFDAYLGSALHMAAERAPTVADPRWHEAHGQLAALEVRMGEGLASGEVEAWRAAARAFWPLLVRLYPAFHTPRFPRSDAGPAAREAAYTEAQIDRWSLTLFHPEVAHGYRRYVHSWSTLPATPSTRSPAIVEQMFVNQADFQRGLLEHWDPSRCGLAPVPVTAGARAAANRVIRAVLAEGAPWLTPPQRRMLAGNHGIALDTATEAAKHASWDVARLNGGIHGLTPLIYVGGVHVDDQEAYLWVSFHGVGTYWTRSGPDDTTIDCNVIWSWNIEDSRTGVPVEAVLDEYCDTTPTMYTGHGHPNNDCRFGFFPLGAYHVTVNETDKEFQFNSVGFGDRKGEFFDYGMSQVNDLGSGSTESQVDAAIADGFFDHFKVKALDLFGDNIDPGQSDDSLYGIDWHLKVSPTHTEDYDYITRTDKFNTAPTDFLDNIDSRQGNLSGWNTDCTF